MKPIFILLSVCLIFSGCKKETKPTCSDGIQNQGEQKVDCGGPCTACESCKDGIKNQDETGLDCGGSCTACLTCSDGIINQGETGVDCGGPCPTCFIRHMTALINSASFASGVVAGSTTDTTIKFQSDQSQNIQLFFYVPRNVVPGNYDIVNTPLFNVNYVDVPSGAYFDTFQGNITISSNNASKRELSGTFNFKVFKEDGFGNVLDTISVTQGDFATDY